MDIYKETIIHHYQNPQNTGQPDSFTHKYKLQNLSCGDEIEVFITASDNEIQDVHYVAEGCAISIASASILSEEIKGMELSKLKSLDEKYVLDLLGIELTMSRVKCAHLALDAVQQAVNSPQTTPK
jgi:nitrogen fixation NifU-like protein